MRMKFRNRFCIAALAACLLGACGLVDSRVEWRGGPYALLWTDEPQRVHLSRQISDGQWAGRIDEVVFAVGWDGRYLVAKQHPGGDRATTNYFIIDSASDTPASEANKVVIGPLSEVQYQTKAQAMHLPGFAKTLAALE
jgi:hypothetical protein